jgi:hypothetical protein
MKTLNDAKWKVGDVVSLARWNRPWVHGSSDRLPDVAAVMGVRLDNSQSGIIYLVAGRWLDEAWLLPFGVGPDVSRDDLGNQR